VFFHARYHARAAQPTQACRDLGADYSDTADTVGSASRHDEHFARTFDLLETEPRFGARGSLSPSWQSLAQIEDAPNPELRLIESPKKGARLAPPMPHG
jgi:hypothetical protein